jgi:hypothetical protein
MKKSDWHPWTFSGRLRVMKIPALTAGMGAFLFLTACKTQRTVLAGPTVTGVDAQGLKDPKAQSTGFQDNSGRGTDPNGYQQNANGGLNALSDKMFGGKLESQSQKEFDASKNYLTREYGGGKKFDTKNWQGEPKSKTWTDQLFDTGDNHEGELAFKDAGREAAVKDSPDAGKTARTGDFAGGSKTARTGNYRAAERALEAGRDDPKLTSARPDRMSTQEKAIHDRIANSNASASEINKFLGKP